jgi:hypothetical protein
VVIHTPKIVIQDITYVNAVINGYSLKECPVNAAGSKKLNVFAMRVEKSMNGQTIMIISMIQRYGL